jgi:chaperonin GroES
MGYRPIYDRILVRRDEAATKTAGGLEIAEEHRKPPTEGTVVEVGAGRLHDNGTLTPLLVQAGDRVLFGVYAGTEIPEAAGMGKDMMIMREDEVMGFSRESI